LIMITHDFLLKKYRIEVFKWIVYACISSLSIGIITDFL
jgi:hypothetical protein